jgi:hypothetical protein
MVTASRTLASLVSLAALGVTVSLAACGGSQPPPPPPPPPPPVAPTASTDPTPPPQPPPAQTQEEAHKLLVLATSCWFGGVWSDALGEQDQAKVTGIETRCHELERRVWGADDKTHYEQMRAFEQNAGSDIVAKVDETAKGDAVDGPRREALVKLATSLEAAFHETMAARRAADRVKRDLGHEPEKLSQDEVDAVLPLRAHSKLESLLNLEVGDLTKEANALAILCALDRVELARGLPKHLKLYAVVDSFSLLFGVTVPDVPENGTKKLVPGTWLRFLTDTAKAAGHPVPDKARTPREKDALAWGGMLEGFHDKLKVDADAIAPSTDVSKVVTVVLHRLEAEYNAQRAAESTVKPPKPGKAPKK